MRFFYTLSIILLMSAQAKSQSRTTPQEQEPPKRVIKFYPNPATSYITFDFQKDYDRSYTFQIFNFLGKKVYELNDITPKTTVDLTDFYRGVYIFQLRDKNSKVVSSGKFQVSK